METCIRWDAMKAACPTRQVIARIADKWAMLVISALEGEEALRFSELRRRIEGVSQKMLTQTLRALERDGLVSQDRLPDGAGDGRVPAHAPWAEPDGSGRRDPRLGVRAHVRDRACARRIRWTRRLVAMILSSRPETLTRPGSTDRGNTSSSVWSRQRARTSGLTTTVV